MNGIKQPVFIHRPEVDYPEVSKDYPNCNVLGEGPNRSRKRMNYTTTAAIITAVIYGLSWLLFR